MNTPIEQLEAELDSAREWQTTLDNEGENEAAASYQSHCSDLEQQIEELREQ